MTNDDLKNLCIPNYVLADQFCRGNRKGGSCILVKKYINYQSLITVKNYSISNIVECCGIVIPQHNITIICIYRVPHSKNKKEHLNTFFDIFDNIIKTLPLTTKIIICGDFNINTLADDKCVSDFKQLLLVHNLRLSINEPTRPVSGTCLDNIIHDIRGCRAYVKELALSDHKAQILTCPVKITPKFNHWFAIRRDYSSDNIIKFVNCISVLSFSDSFQTDDANRAFDCFLEEFQLYYNLCFPKIRVKFNVNVKPKWISKGIRLCSKRKRQLLWEYRCQPNEESRQKFKTFSRRLKKIINMTQKTQNVYQIRNSRNK